MKNVLSDCIPEPTFKSRLRMPFSVLVQIDYEPTDFVLRNRDNSPVILITLDYDDDAGQHAVTVLKNSGLPDWIEQYAFFSFSRSGRVKFHCIFDNFQFDHVKMASALADKLSLPHSFDKYGIDTTFAVKSLYFAAYRKRSMSEETARALFDQDVFNVCKKEFISKNFYDDLDIYDFVKKFTPLMRDGCWNRLEYIAAVKAVQTGVSFEQLYEVFRLLPGWYDYKRASRLRLTYNWAQSKYGNSNYHSDTKSYNHSKS